MSESRFVMLDGLDGVGKGTGEQAILRYLQKGHGMKVFDQVAFEKKEKERPKFSVGKKPGFINVEDFDVVYMGEPSYAASGWDVRFEQIARENKGRYTARETLDGYSFNRLVHYKRCVIPVRKAGLHVIQSRGLGASKCFQGLQAQEEGNPLTDQELLARPGNALALDHYPDILIIPTIKDPTDLQERLANRPEQDDTFLESLPFQLKLKPWFESDDLRRLFEKAGSKVEYIDAGVSIPHTEKAAVGAVRYLFE